MRFPYFAKIAAATVKSDCRSTSTASKRKLGMYGPAASLIASLSQPRKRGVLTRTYRPFLQSARFARVELIKKSYDLRIRYCEVNIVETEPVIMRDKRAVKREVLIEPFGKMLTLAAVLKKCDPCL
jgi:hypothetical protein